MRNYKLHTISAILLLSAITCFGSAIEDISTNGYAVFSGTNLSTGNNVSINGNTGAAGSTWLANDTTVTGNVDTGTRFSTGNNVSITGDINYGNSFWMGNNSTVGGDAYQSYPNLTTIDLPSISSGNDSLWYKKNSTVNLDPGSYGSLSVSKDSKIYLTSGTYNFKNIWFDKDVEIILDTSDGDVVINSASSFSTGQNVILSSDGLNGAYIYANNNLSLGNNNNFTASLISNSGISIDNSSLIDGMIYANKDVWLSNNVNVTGANFYSKTPIPEPATALLLLTSLPYVIKRARHKEPIKA